MENEPASAESKLIFSTQKDIKKAILITFIAFLFCGFQAAIYGMTTVPVSEFFGKLPETIVKYDSFGMWGQILAMATVLQSLLVDVQWFGQAIRIDVC